MTIFGAINRSNKSIVIITIVEIFFNLQLKFVRSSKLVSLNIRSKRRRRVSVE